MRKTTKEGFADAGQVIRNAMRAWHPDADPYTQVQLAVDQALVATEPSVADAAIRRAQLTLASIAASPRFDLRRHRAVQQCLRELALLDRQGRTTRKAP